MINKKVFLLKFLLLFLVFLSFELSALTIIPLSSQSANFSNVSGSLNVSIGIGEVGTESYIGRYTFAYAPWFYTVANGTYRHDLGQTNGTGNNQTFFNPSARNTLNANEWPDGKNYSFNMSIWNYDTGTLNLSLFLYNITIDNTAPLTAAVGYTNATPKNTTQQLTMNISVVDATVGLLNSSNSFCFVNVNGTNRSVPEINGWCNSTTLPVTGLSEGNNTIRVYANDTLGNLRLNSTLALLVDSTTPTANATCNSTSVEVESAFPCSCSGSDALSGLLSATGTSDSSDGTSTPVTTGNFTYTCTSTDNAGNIGTDTENYSVINSSSAEEEESSSNGAGISTTNSLTTIRPVIHQFSTVTPDETLRAEYIDPVLALKEISIDLNTQVQSVRISVVRYDQKPAEVTIEKTGVVYQYIEINVSNVVDKLEKATIVSKVEKSWASINNVPKENVTVSKFDSSSGEWKDLPTTFSSEDDAYYYYDTEVTSFSFFVISGVATSGEASTSDEITDAINITEDGKFTKFFFWIIPIAIILVLVVVFVIKKARERENALAQEELPSGSQGIVTQEDI